MERKYVIRAELPLDWGAAYYDLAAMVDAGNVRLPSFLVLDFPGAGEQPSVRIEAELVEGSFKATEVSFSAKPGSRGVTSDDLRAVRVDSWIQQVAQMVSQDVSDNPGGGRVAGWGGPGSLSSTGRRVVESMMPKRGRKPLGDDHYRRVARAYLDGGRRAAAVESAFDTTFSTAARWVRKARDLGFLDEDAAIGSASATPASPAGSDDPDSGAEEITADDLRSFAAWYADQPGGRELRPIDDERRR